MSPVYEFINVHHVVEGRAVYLLLLLTNASEQSVIGIGTYSNDYIDNSTCSIINYTIELSI